MAFEKEYKGVDKNVYRPTYVSATSLRPTVFGGLRPGSEHTIKLEKECNGLTSCKSHNSNCVMATPIRPGIELAVAHLVHELGSDVSSEASSARPVRRSKFQAAERRRRAKVACSNVLGHLTYRLARVGAI